MVPEEEGEGVWGWVLLAEEWGATGPRLSQGRGDGPGGPVTPSSQGPSVTLSVGPAWPSPSFLMMMEQIRAKYKHNLKLS